MDITVKFKGVTSYTWNNVSGFESISDLCSCAGKCYMFTDSKGFGRNVHEVESVLIQFTDLNHFLNISESGDNWQLTHNVFDAITESTCGAGQIIYTGQLTECLKIAKKLARGQKES